MKKHQLIKHAYDNYPKGTVFLSCVTESKITSCGVFHLSKQGSVVDSESKMFVKNYTSDKWATIVTDERKPLLKSEDGVDLFEGDEYWIVSCLSTQKWWLNCCQKLQAHHVVITRHVVHKAFSTREAAEVWIKEANKPKEIVFDHTNIKIVVFKDKFYAEAKTDSRRFTFDMKDIENINSAIKQLQS